MVKRMFTGTAVVTGMLVAVCLVNPKLGHEVCRWVFDLGTDIKAVFREGTRQSEKEKYAAEEKKLNAEVAELKAKVTQMEAAGETSKAAEYAHKLKAVEAKLAEVRKLQRKYMLDLAQAQHEYERRKQSLRTTAVVQEELKALNALLALEVDMTQLKQQDLNDKLAEVVNAFLNTVEEGSNKDVSEMCTKDLQLAMNKDKLKVMRRGMPEGGFQLRHTVAGRECEVMFNGKHFLTLSNREGEWLVSKVW